MYCLINLEIRYNREYRSYIMIYKTYGKTGKKVSAVGFGGMRFDQSKSIKENAELIRYANSMGINYFDTAPGYCNDTSEIIFGEAFKDMPGEFYVSTKGKPTQFDTAEKAIEAVKKSIERLGVKIYYMYSPHNIMERSVYRKPKTGLIEKFLMHKPLLRRKVLVIGDQQTDAALAKQMGDLSFVSVQYGECISESTIEKIIKQKDNNNHSYYKLLGLQHGRFD